jgi:hypothetical protein
MKRLLVVAACAAVLVGAGASGAQAKPPDTVQWVCDVPDEPEPVVFVTAAEAARHGIDIANNQAGQVFHDQFGEVCTVL